MTADEIKVNVEGDRTEGRTSKIKSRGTPIGDPHNTEVDPGAGSTEGQQGLLSSEEVEDTGSGPPSP